jgi:hypothetical protein
MLVPVLITSCHVSDQPKMGPVIAQTAMRATANRNVIGDPTCRSIQRANRSKASCRWFDIAQLSTRLPNSLPQFSARLPPRSNVIYPTFARFRRFRGEDRALERSGQRQIAVAAGKWRSKPAIDDASTAALPHAPADRLDRRPARPRDAATPHRSSAEPSPLTPPGNPPGSVIYNWQRSDI